MISMSGAFSVTFSVIFAYVADVTDERERSTAYGLVSTATSRKASGCVFSADVSQITSRSPVSLFQGVGHLRSQPGDQPSHRRLPVGLVRRQPGGAAGHAHLPGRHRLHPASRARVAARQDEAQHLGGAHLLGAGRPLHRQYSRR